MKLFLKFLALPALIWLLVVTPVVWLDLRPPLKTVRAEAESNTVTLAIGSTRGSGVIITRRDLQGRRHSYIWTVGHLAVEAESDSGYDPIEVSRYITDGGKVVGRTILTATVIKCDTEADLALLELNSNFFSDEGVEFVTQLPIVAEPLFHYGSPYGEAGANSFTAGSLAKLGFTIDGVSYDFVTTSAAPGCSGGGVFNARGECLGLVARQTASTVCFIIPARRLAEWAEKQGVPWAFNPNLRVK